MNINVTYMSGAGNLFSVINNEEYKFPIAGLTELAPVLCGTKGENYFRTEGLLAISKGNQNTTFRVDFLNPDGSSSMMCGNGARCSILFAYENSFLPGVKNGNTFSFFMAGKSYIGRMMENSILVYFHYPYKTEDNISVEADGVNFTGDYIDVGSDHFVVNLENVPKLNEQGFENFNLMKFGRLVRNHERFKPAGVNFNLYLPISKDQLLLRTYERGVEAETGACGTGAISTALSAAARGDAFFPVTVIPPSGIPLKVDILGSMPYDDIEHIILEGPAEVISSTNIEV